MFSLTRLQQAGEDEKTWNRIVHFRVQQNKKMFGRKHLKALLCKTVQIRYGLHSNVCSFLPIKINNFPLFAMLGLLVFSHKKGKIR